MLNLSFSPNPFKDQFVLDSKRSEKAMIYYLCSNTDVFEEEHNLINNEKMVLGQNWPKGFGSGHWKWHFKNQQID